MTSSPLRFRPILRICLWAGLLGAAGCVDINGGAVEVSWAIFAPGGRAITDCSCTSPAIAQIRLNLSSVVDGSNPCADSSSCRFACGHKTGSTPFMIPPGRYAMSVTAISADGIALDAGQGFRSTPPLSRPVEWGKPTDLDAYEIEAPCSDTCNGQSMTQPCARP